MCTERGFSFASDLFRACENLPAEIAFIRLKSYEGTGSTGVVKKCSALPRIIEGRTVIVVEDIVDTGHTIARLIENLKEKNPAEIKVATLLFQARSLEEKTYTPTM